MCQWQTRRSGMRLAPWRSDRHRLSLLLGFGPNVALLAPRIAMIVLPLPRVFHPPVVAVAMCPALLHSGARFAIRVVLHSRLPQ
jgi:hypothetical protein